MGNIVFDRERNEDFKTLIWIHMVSQTGYADIRVKLKVDNTVVKLIYKQNKMTTWIEGMDADGRR